MKHRRLSLVPRSACFVMALSVATPAFAQIVVGQAPAAPQAPASPLPVVLRITGQLLRSSDSSAVVGARVTLFSPDLTFFREIRSDANGRYLIGGIPDGTYKLGVAFPGLQYVESDVVLASGVQVFDIQLDPETEIGRWDVIGSTLPEQLDATDIGALLPTGDILYCHDTQDSILFNPVTGQKTFPAGSTSAQGCMNTTLLADGGVLMVGGQDGSEPWAFQDAIPWVKRWGLNGVWQNLPDLNLAVGRWYPGLARLNDGRLLAMGGGTAPSAVRTDTCEIFDPVTNTWSYTGSLGAPLEFPPSALLYTGDVLQTWGPRPELYNVQTGQWTPTGQLVASNRSFPGHADHSLLVLTDGRALVVGALPTGAAMTEYYDPAAGTWSAGTSPSLKRFQSEIVYLPNGEVFVGGGDIGNGPSGGEPEILRIVRRCDLLDPDTGAWRRVPDMFAFREYHGVSLLIPDGRVTTTGGTYIKFQYGPTSADIEAYSPPYLFRGVRPQIELQSNGFAPRGATVDLTVFPQTQLTGAVLMGVQTTTHWLDGGIPRRLELDVNQVAGQAQVILPSDPNLLPVGWYMLFGMVDDIPSEAVFLRVDP